jgi:glycosyltransferase involved in cell wall biosynthesis
MRIALVSVSGQLGGSEAVLLQLVGEINRLRSSWDVRLVSLMEGPLVDRAKALDAGVHVVPMPRSVASLGEWGGRRRALGLLSSVATAAGDLRVYQRQFSDALGAIDPDVVHTNGFKAHVMAARMSTRALRLWHIHEYVSSRPVTRRLLRRYGSHPDLVVANSLSVANDVTCVVKGRLRRPVRVIHNGVDLDRFRTEGPAADLDAICGLPRAEAGTVRVGLVATFARWKGHDTFLRAMARLDHVPVRGYIIGGALYDTAGSQWSLEQLRAEVDALGLGSRVGFTGFQPDMPAFVRALDVVVHASNEPEPFGLAILEGMASGKAVVTTGMGGAGEIVEHDHTAVVHAAGDPHALAMAIERLAADAALRARLGSAARAAAEQRFSAARFGEAFVSLYEAVR